MPLYQKEQFSVIADLLKQFKFRNKLRSVNFLRLGVSKCAKFFKIYFIIVTEKMAKPHMFFIVYQIAGLLIAGFLLKNCKTAPVDRMPAKIK